MKKKAPKKFGISVFINCPFDEEYKSLLRPMLFTLVYARLVPRLASEKSDSLEQRIEMRAVQALQHWLIETLGLTDVKSPTVIWNNFNEFNYDFYQRRKAQGYSQDDLKMMPVPQYIRFITQWIQSNRRN